MQKAPVEKSLLGLLAAAAETVEAILRDSFAGTPLHGITRAQVSVFRELDRSGPATLSDLARAVGVTGQAMGESVRRLEARGLVTVVPDPRDSRARVVSLSPLGRDMLDGLRHHLGHLETRLAAVIGSSALSELKVTLALIPALRQLPETAPTGSAV